MTNESIYESGEYLENNPDWGATDAPVKARWIAEILMRNKISPASIVDIGCGAGEIVIELAGRFPNTKIAGYDISPQSHAIAAPKSKAGVSFHQANYLEVEAPIADVVMAIDVFEHVDDYLGFIRAMAPKGAWKVFHIPLDLSVQGMIRGGALMGARRKLGHLHHFYKETALATVRDCGLEVVDWNYTFGTEELPDRKFKTKLGNLPRKLLRAASVDLSVRMMGGASMMVLAR